MPYRGIIDGLPEVKWRRAREADRRAMEQDQREQSVSQCRSMLQGEGSSNPPQAQRPMYEPEA